MQVISFGDKNRAQGATKNWYPAAQGKSATLSAMAKRDDALTSIQKASAPDALVSWREKRNRTTVMMFGSDKAIKASS